MPSPSIVWFRDDLRLADHPALRAAVDRGEPVIGLYVLDEESEGIRPLVEPMFAAAEARGALREGVTPDDALQWLFIVASGLLRSPGPLPEREELTRLLQLMLVPALLDTSGD